MLRNSSLWLTVALVGTLAFGCSDDSEQTKNDTGTVADSGVDGMATQEDGSVSEDQGEAQAPEVAFAEDFADYDDFKGEASLEVVTSGTVTKVELLAGETVLAASELSPFTLTWDTTATADGIVQISLKASGPAGEATAAARPVIVINNGEEVTEWLYELDGFGTYEVPADWEPNKYDLHQKRHYAMPAGIHKVISVTTWDNAAMHVDLAIGTGTCPHSGEEAAREGSETSPLAVEFVSSDLALSSGVQWFNHFGVLNEADVVGQTSNWTVRTFLFR